MDDLEEEDDLDNDEIVDVETVETGAMSLADDASRCSGSGFDDRDADGCRRLMTPDDDSRDLYPGRCKVITGGDYRCIAFLLILFSPFPLFFLFLFLFQI